MWPPSTARRRSTPGSGMSKSTAPYSTVAPSRRSASTRGGEVVGQRGEAVDRRGDDGHVAVDRELRRRGRLVRIVDPGHRGELAAARPRVQALRVAALALLERGRDMDLDERDAGVVVHLARERTRAGVRAHERDEREGAA